VVALNIVMNSYDGKPCKKCNATLRYKSNNACVSCERKRCRLTNYKQQHKQHQSSDDYKKRRREYKYRYLYGLSTEEMFSMRQSSICPICLAKPKRFCVDHDHQTGKVRGLLCYRCNTGLGLFLENPDVLKRAVYYLEKERATQNSE